MEDLIQDKSMEELIRESKPPDLIGPKNRLLELGANESLSAIKNSTYANHIYEILQRINAVPLNTGVLFDWKKLASSLDLFTLLQIQVISYFIFL